MMIMSDTSSLKRWELSSLRETRNDLTSPSSIAKLAQELIESKEKAKLEGHALGYQEGYENGYQAGLESGLKASEPIIQEKVNGFSNLEVQLINLLNFGRENLAQEVLDLAIDLAKAMVYKSISQDPQCILEVIHQCLLQIPILEQPAKLILHPEDAKLVHQYQGPDLIKQGWKIVENPDLSRGGCRFETGSSLIDASIESRFEKLLHGLGKEAPSSGFPKIL